MPRLRPLSRSGWIVLGIVIGAVAIPAVAIATAAQLVTIRGNDHNASVSSAGQLRTIAMDPSSTLHTETAADPNTCVPLFTVPANRSMMVRHINVSVADITSTPNPYINVTTGTCGQSQTSFLADVRIDTRGLISIPLGDGIPLPAGTQINAFLHDADGFVDLFGYTMVQNAVPATAVALHRSGPAHVDQPTAKGG